MAFEATAIAFANSGARGDTAAIVRRKGSVSDADASERTILDRRANACRFRNLLCGGLPNKRETTNVQPKMSLVTEIQIDALEMLVAVVIQRSLASIERNAFLQIAY